MMKKIILLCTIVLTLFADFHNKIYSDVCYTFVHNRRDLQPSGAKALEIRADVVNSAYITSKVVIWEREKEYNFPVLPLIEDDVIIRACRDTLESEKKSDASTFVFYATYQRAVYDHAVEALMKLAKAKQKEK